MRAGGRRRAAASKFGRQLALFGDTGDNGQHGVLVDRVGGFERLDNVAQLFFIQLAGGFLAVAGDKGQCVAGVEQLDGGGDA